MQNLDILPYNQQGGWSINYGLTHKGLKGGDPKFLQWEVLGK